MVLVTGSNGMVGHCIRNLVEGIKQSHTNQINSSDLHQTKANLEQTWENLRERQDRDSLMALLDAIVP